MADGPDVPDKIQMLTQPLLTEDGFINEACMRELESALRNMPETFDRLANEPEWTIKAWICVPEICGQLARWSVVQAVGVPPGLHEVIGYLFAVINRDARFTQWENLGFYAELSLCEINRLLWDCLRDLRQFQDWNDFNVMSEHGLQWIDLSALLHNVCVAIRNDRRHDVAFNAEFKRDQGGE